AAGERHATADFLADIAEFDARRRYLPKGYDSMYAYCLGELKLSEDAAVMRIGAARAARQFPDIFPALAEGELCLTAAYRLSRHLIDQHGPPAPGGEERLAAAMGRTKAETERLIAERFPRPDVPSRLEALSATPAPGIDSPVPERVNGDVSEPVAGPRSKLA